MVLPPLELFSLRKELPCCRAALSVFAAVFSDPELAEGTPADVGQDGAAHDETGNGEGSEQTDPEANAAEWDEESALLAGERDARLVGQERADSHRNQKSRGQTMAILNAS